MDNNNWKVLYRGVKHLDFGVSGIYQITNTVNGKFYIGSAKCFRKRILDHINKLRRGVHANPYIQHTFNKHGFDVFSAKVIEVVGDVETLIEAEQRHLDEVYDEQKQCYNMCPMAGNVLGRKHTEETKKKISEAHKGKIVSEETRKKFSEINKKRTDHHFKPGNSYVKYGAEHHGAVSVMKIDMNTNEVITTYSTLKEAAEGCGRNKSAYTNISRAIKHKTTAFGYRWVKVGDEIPEQWPERRYGPEKGSFTHTEEQKRKISERMKGEKHPRYGKKNSEKANKANRDKHAKTYRFINPQGEEIEFTNLRKFCAENGLSENSMYSVHSGQREKCRGWRKA